jgi:hypothetical protein
MKEGKKMSNISLAIIFIPAGLATAILGLAIVGTAAGLREISKRRVEYARRRTSNELGGLLKRVEEIIKVGDGLKASEFAKEEYNACVSELSELSAQVEKEKSSTNQMLISLKGKTQLLAQKAEAMVERASMEAERVAAVKVSLEVLSKMGFSSKVKTSKDGKWVTIIAIGGRGIDGGKKEIVIDIDDENHIRADFHEGYAGFALGECDEDAHRFFTALQELGAEIRGIQVVPKVPTWHGEDAKELPVYHSRKAV